MPVNKWVVILVPVGACLLFIIIGGMCIVARHSSKSTKDEEKEKGKAALEEIAPGTSDVAPAIPERKGSNVNMPFASAADNRGIDNPALSPLDEEPPIHPTR